MPHRPGGRSGKGCARFSCRENPRTARNSLPGAPATGRGERVVSRRSAANTPPGRFPTTESTKTADEEACQSRSRSYLTIAGTSFLAAHTSATIHPITLHPKKMLSRKIARRSRLLRARAIIDGRKYITNPKQKNGKKINVERVMTALLFYNPASIA